jgi:TPR repeat protein
MLMLLCRDRDMGPLEDLTKRAEAGDAAAQTELGVAFFVGLGVDEDYFEARGWFEEAAEQGDAVAKSWLGEMFWNCLSGEEDKPRAEKLWRESFDDLMERALEGDEVAQHRLARCYFHGRGVAQNFVEAHVWDRTAAKRGYAPAQFDLAGYYVELDGTHPWSMEKGAQATAEWWYLKAALQGHKGAVERLEEIDELMVYGAVAEQKREIAEIKARWEVIRCADLEALMEHDFAELEARLRDGIKATSLFDVVSDKDQEFISYVGPEE